MRLKFLTLAALLLASAQTAHADSTGALSRAARDSAIANGELSEAGVKVVAGAASVPFLVAGAVSAAPGASVAVAGYASDDEFVKNAGTGAMMLAIPVATPGFALMMFSQAPLQISPEIMSAKPAAVTSQTPPAAPAKAQ